MPLQIHHHAWLLLHPDRDEAWLQAKLTEGFDVHHLDHDHSNNNPFNLVLIEANDHMMVHEMRISVKPRHLKRGGPRGPRKPKVRKRKVLPTVEALPPSPPVKAERPKAPPPVVVEVKKPEPPKTPKRMSESMIKFDAAIWAARHVVPGGKVVTLPIPKDWTEYEAMKRMARAQGLDWDIPQPASR